MKIELNKYYKDGSGNIFYILENKTYSDDPFMGYNFSTGHYKPFWSDGSYRFGNQLENLVEEASGQPLVDILLKYVSDEINRYLEEH